MLDVQNLRVFLPSDGGWYSQVSNGFSHEQWGQAGDVLVPGKYGPAWCEKTDAVIFRPGDGKWYIKDLNEVIPFGMFGDVPVPRDYGGTGQASIAVFRPSNGRWYFREPYSEVQFGLSGDIPVPADYQGSGRAEIALFRPSNGIWYFHDPYREMQWGSNGDIPLPGDYVGNGHCEPTVYRPSEGKWYFHDQKKAIAFGTPGDIPIPYDYGFLGYWQLGVYRPSTGEWFVLDPTNNNVIKNNVPMRGIPVPTVRCWDDRNAAFIGEVVAAWLIWHICDYLYEAGTGAIDAAYDNYLKSLNDVDGQWPDPEPEDFPDDDPDDPNSRVR
jgi:putative transposon-encoded protein